jgi:hypothetical protein
MGTTITLNSDTFKYPTREERKKIKKLIPKIDRLKVEYKSATIGILQDSSVETAIRSEDIYWWCNCLNNRLGRLTETFVYVQTHYLRGQEKKDEESQNLHTDKILLDYFIEIFYYYFFSARDVLGQLLNIFCDLKIEEHKIFLNERFVEKIRSKEIKNGLTDFLNNTKDSYNIRNSFNHRFTPTDKDFRAKMNIIKEGNKISFYSAQEVKVETFLGDIENLMKHFGCLMNKLTKEIK